MYGAGYVIIPPSSPRCRPFSTRRSRLSARGVGDLPREKLAFDDVTDALKRLHAEGITLKSGRDGAGVTVVGGNAMAGDLDFTALASSYGPRA